MEIHEHQLIEEVKNNPEGIIYKWAFSLGSEGCNITRHIPPQKIAVVFNQDYGKISEDYRNNKISWKAYRNAKIMTLNVIKKDKVLKKTISWYGSSSQNVLLHVYHTYDECIKEYNKKNYEVISILKQRQAELENTINELDKSFIGTDYVMEHLSNSK